MKFAILFFGFRQCVREEDGREAKFVWVQYQKCKVVGWWTCCIMTKLCSWLSSYDVFFEGGRRKFIVWRCSSFPTYQLDIHLRVECYDIIETTSNSIYHEEDIN